MISLKRNKKGTIDDLPYILVLVFTVFILAFILHRVWSGFAESNAFGRFSPEAKEVQDIVTYNTLPNLDLWVMQMIFGGALVVGILAFISRSHPIFIPIALVIIIIVIFISHAISEAGVGMLDSAAFAQQKAEMPITYWIMDKLEIIMLFISAFVMITTYAFFGSDVGI